jgi:hypothetical protein
LTESSSILLATSLCSDELNRGLEREFGKYCESVSAV